MAGDRQDRRHILLVALSAGFAAAYVGLVLLHRWLVHRGSEPDAFIRLLGYACLPAALWVGTAVLTPRITLDLLNLAMALVVVACVLAVATTRVIVPLSGPSSVDLAGYGLLALVFGTASSVTAPIGLNRLAIQTTGQLAWVGLPTPLVLAVVAATLTLGLVLWAVTRRERSETRLHLVLLGAQALLPLGFFVVVPAPWLPPDSRPVLPVDATRIILVALALATAGWIDLLRRVLTLCSAGAAPRLHHAISPLAIIALLVAIKVSPVLFAVIPEDDYHFGEGVLPWYLLSAHGQVPFVDHAPARGLVNYLAAAAGELFFDGTVPSLSAAAPLVAVLIALVGVLSVSTVTGILPAAAMFVAMPLANGLSEIDILNTAALCVLVAGLDRWREDRWLLTWLALGTGLVLYAPGQGGLLVMATVPLGLVQAGRAWLDSPRRLGQAALLAGGIAMALSVLTPIGAMVLAALRYVREQSAVNAVAHGIEWSLGFGAGPLQAWLWEALRAGWMLLAVVATVIVVEAVRAGDRARLLRVAPIAVPIGLLAVLFILRVAIRIDPGFPSRLALATSWMWTLLLPLLLHAAWGAGRWHSTLAFGLAGAGVWAATLGGGIDLRRAAQRGLEVSPFPASAVRGDMEGLPQIGVAEIASAHLARLATLKRTLDGLLAPSETYLDLTNRNAQYVYMGRPTPIESGAVYNLPNDVQQLRAIDRLDRAPVPVVLIAGDAFNFDGGPPSLRAHAIYRYVTGLRYRAIRVGPLVLLARQERVERGVANGLLIEGGDPAALLDAAFRPGDLRLVPDSWGRSWDTLRRTAVEVRKLGAPSGHHDVHATGADSYRSTGRDPFVTWRLTPAQDGRAAGLLTFDFVCLQGDGNTSLEVYWGSPGAPPSEATMMLFHAGARLAVPLDAAPRWLQQQHIDELRIDIRQPDQCPEFRVANVALWQRRAAADVEARLRRYH